MKEECILLSSCSTDPVKKTSQDAMNHKEIVIAPCSYSLKHICIPGYEFWCVFIDILHWQVKDEIGKTFSIDLPPIRYN